MPNICDFSIKAVGKKESLDELLAIMNNGYHYCSTKEEIQKEEERGNYKLRFSLDGGEVLFTNHDKHLYRVFECDKYDEDVTKAGQTAYYLTGNCAWSVYSCMFQGYGTYYSSCPERTHHTTLPLISKDLGVDVEVYSSEPGMAFAEHYIIEKGEVLVDECVEYEEYYTDDEDLNIQSKADMEKLIGRHISDAEWNETNWFAKCEFNMDDPTWHI